MEHCKNCNSILNDYESIVCDECIKEELMQLKNEEGEN